VARAIHASGQPGSGPLVELDAAALPPPALAAELELLAAGGGTPAGALLTVLLRDPFELPRDLQERVVALARDPSLRWLATSREAPDAARRAERLLAPFDFLLTTLVLELPPLRDRRPEIPVLAQHALECANRSAEPRRLGFEPSALDILDRYDWPGNLAELARVVAWAHPRAEGDLIGPADLPPEIQGALGGAYAPPPMPPPVTPLDATLEHAERRLIEQALAWARHNKSRAAEALAISRPRLYRRMKDLDIPDLGDSGDA
jgi:DNA-binding NtrC family response regulator